MMTVVFFSLSGLLAAGERLEIKGSFGSGLKNGIPEGWHANKPGNWDEPGKVSLGKIPDTEKYALRITSQTKAMHLYYGTPWPIAMSDKCVIKAIVRGKGMGELGIYTYPWCGMPSKEFRATDEWTECVAEVPVRKATPETETIRIVIVVSPGASIEFMDVNAEMVKTQE